MRESRSSVCSCLDRMAISFFSSCILPNPGSDRVICSRSFPNLLPSGSSVNPLKAMTNRSQAAKARPVCRL